MTKSTEESGEKVVQLAMDHTMHPWLLTSEGRIFRRGDDPSKVNQPNGPHWAWHEVAGPL